MWITKLLAGLVMTVACVPLALAVDTVPLSKPTPGPHEFYAPKSQGKTRAQVMRELEVARASGCIDGPDNQYPQPCPVPAGGQGMVE